MKASEQKKLSLEVKTADESSEVFIIDGRFKMVDRGRGQSNTFSLTPGIYTVKVRAGSESREEHVVLFDKPEKVEFPRIEFASPAPLADTGKTHEYHIAAAAAESQRVHVQKGSGSSLFVFVRDWTSKERSDAGDKPNSRPQTGLKLLDAHGEVVADLEKESNFNEQDDPWAACNVQVNPGIYRLALELACGDTIEQTVVASKDWQTQVFLLQRNYAEDGSERRADLLGASILLAKKGFQPDDPQKRLVEAARLGLVNTRQVLPDQVINEILNGKFKNPMLGIFGAHLLMLGKQIKLDLLRIIVRNLRKLLGENQHPDVEALALRLGTKETSYIFEFPPMLRRSWWQVVDATVDNELLVPFGSVAAQSAEHIWGDEPWLQWMTPQKIKAEAMYESVHGASTYEPGIGRDAIEIHLRNLDLQGGTAFASATEDRPSPGGSFESFVVKAKKSGKKGGAKARKSMKGGGKGMKAKAAAVSQARKRKPKAGLNKNELRMMVKSSGLPRANVQVLFNQYAQYKSASAAEAAEDTKVKDE